MIFGMPIMKTSRHGFVLKNGHSQYG